MNVPLALSHLRVLSLLININAYDDNTRTLYTNQVTFHGGFCRELQIQRAWSCCVDIFNLQKGLCGGIPVEDPGTVVHILM